MPWWAWVLIAVVVGGLTAGVLLRRHLRFAMKVAKAVATDQRLPKPLRWAIGVALAMKVVPFPDFGVDEIILVVVGTLLLTVYRSTFRAIVAETRAAEEAPAVRAAEEAPAVRPPGETAPGTRW